MGRGKLSENEIEILKKNPYVIDVSENRIIYSNEFKYYFMEEYNSGKKPRRIFSEAGFDPKILGSKRIERAAYRWRESYQAGSLGVYQEAHINQKTTGKQDYQQESHLIKKLQEFEEVTNRLQIKVEELQREVEELRSSK